MAATSFARADKGMPYNIPYFLGSMVKKYKIVQRNIITGDGSF